MTMSSQRALALGGLVTALHVILLFLMNIVPGSELLVLFGLPVVGALYYQLTSTRHAFIFAFATILLVLLLDPIKAVIWMIPSVIIGITYGALIRFKFQAVSIILTLSLVHAVVLYLSLILGGALLGLDPLTDLQTDFFHWDAQEAWMYGPLVLWIYGLSQAIVTHFITARELERLKVKVTWETTFPRWAMVAYLLLHMGGIVLALIPATQSLAVTAGVFSITLAIGIIVYSVKQGISVIIFIIAAFVMLLSLVGAIILSSGASPLFLFGLSNYSLFILAFYYISLYSTAKNR